MSQHITEDLKLLVEFIQGKIDGIGNFLNSQFVTTDMELNSEFSNFVGYVHEALTLIRTDF